MHFYQLVLVLYYNQRHHIEQQSNLSVYDRNSKCFTGNHINSSTTRRGIGYDRVKSRINLSCFNSRACFNMSLLDITIILNEHRDMCPF